MSLRKYHLAETAMMMGIRQPNVSRSSSSWLSSLSQCEDPKCCLESVTQLFYFSVCMDVSSS